MRWVAALAGVLLAATGTGVALWRRHLRWRVLLNDRIPGHHVHWQQRGRVDAGTLLYTALGDSAALGLGASKPDAGYVGIVAAEIAALSGERVRVRNLSIDGATLDVCIREQLPRLAQLQPDVCTLDIGANDVWTFEPARFRRELEVVCAALPPGSIVAELPHFSVVPVDRRVRAANRIVHEVAARHGFPVAPLYDTTRRGGVVAAVRAAAGDLFHPNDIGHRRWAEAFLPAVREAVERRRSTQQA